MDRYTQDSTKKVEWRDTEFTIGMMAHGIKAIGKTIILMAKGNISGMMVVDTLASGRIT